MIAKDGTVHLVGNGRANHAGLGDPDVLAAVIAERRLPDDDQATVDGNRHFYGFECESAGTGRDPWPDVQVQAIEKAAAAVCRAHGWGAGSVLGHLEWQPGKVDPKGFAMDDMRARVAGRLGLDMPTPPPRPARPVVDLSVCDRFCWPHLDIGVGPAGGVTGPGQGASTSVRQVVLAPPRSVERAGADGGQGGSVNRIGSGDGHGPPTGSSALRISTVFDPGPLDSPIRGGRRGRHWLGRRRTGGPRELRSAAAEVVAGLSAAHRADVPWAAGSLRG